MTLNIFASPYHVNETEMDIKLGISLLLNKASPEKLGNSLTLRPLRTSILVPPAAYVSCWGVAGAATHLSAVTQSCLLCRVASQERCPTFIPFRHDKNIELYGYCSFAF